MRQKLSIAILVVLLALGFVPLKGWVFPTEARSAQSIQLVGLRAPVRVIRDSNYIPHIYGESEHDVFFMQGYLHAQDRLFQMDSFRRLVSGTLAELVGQSALSSDVQSRTLGLRRAAEASATEYPPESLAMMQAYADGVNAWLMDSNTQLPPEYGALEISKSGVPEWTPVDCIVMAKGLAFQLSQSISEEIALSLKLSGYQNAGEDGGFDGTALFFEDTFRSAPFDPTVSIPGFMPGASLSAADKHRNPMVEASRNLQKVMTPEVRQLLQNYLDTIKTSSHLSAFMDRRAAEIGSNWWVIGGSNTDTGHPMLASDPHLSLSTPPIWYEAHLVVSDDPDFGPMNVNGVTLPGTPGVVLGSNEHICWAATVDPMDVTDVYLEELRPSPNSPVPGFTVFDGEEEPIVVIPQQFRVNLVGDGMPDNLVPANVPPDQGGLAFIVPRRNNGPIVQVLFGTLGLSVQYTGWGATRELDTFRTWWRARNIDDFKRGLQNFDFGNQNWSYADVDGNIAYFTDVEVPVREDLQAGTISGVPPFLIRDGTHTNLNEWLPVQNPQPGQALDYEILPFDELPHVVNPSQGYIANANQDPIGTTVDNNPLNQLRPGGGIYYLNVGYDGGFRMGRINRLIQSALANGGKISMADMMRFHGNNQMLDAEVLVPYIAAAWNNGRGADGDLGTLAGDPGITEAIARLQQWDFSTPTGLQAGYDPGDDPSNLPEPSAEEVRASVAATIYSVWRSRILANTIDDTLKRIGLGSSTPPNDQAMAALRSLLEDFDTRQGVGVSGINFFSVPGAPSPEAARDILILKSVREALDLLAGDSFAAAFARSTNQLDYRWGKLHRIVFRHPLGGPFDIPTAGGFSNLAPNLAGFARSGGYQVVDASSHSARASSVNGFMFGSGPSRRFIGEMATDEVNAFQIIPGGQSVVLGSPFYANMMGRWLTNQYHPVLISMSQVQGDVMSEETYTP